MKIEKKRLYLSLKTFFYLLFKNIDLCVRCAIQKKQDKYCNICLSLLAD